MSDDIQLIKEQIKALKPEEHVPDISATNDNYDVGWCDGYKEGYKAAIEAISKILSRY